ncbi:MAG: hypothetical protein ACM3ZB_17000 [bacterium]
MSTAAFIRDALAAGDGILRLAPCWVPRAFQTPGGRLRLDPRDLYALGAHRGGIDERWFASTTRADNGPGTPEDEGLSYIVLDGRRMLLKDAVESFGDLLLGAETMREHGGWNVLCKFFDNMGPLPLHMHQTDEHAARVGARGKPESYYFPPQYNQSLNSFPYTFMGLNPGTTKDDICRCLERWNEGDNGILYHSRAYKLRPGTGWDIPAGVLHAPGSLVTYEPQLNSDVFAMFQSLCEDRPVPRDLLVRNVPPELHDDLDYIVGMLDWEGNLDPDFVTKRFMEPVPVRDESEMAECGYCEKWISYRTRLFSAKELTILPGRTAVIRDAAAYGAVVVQGHGRVGALDVEAPSLIRYGQMTRDELFVTSAAAAAGVPIRNASSAEPLVILKHFGPGDAEPLVGRAAS